MTCSFPTFTWIFSCTVDIILFSLTRSTSIGHTKCTPFEYSCSHTACPEASLSIRMFFCPIDFDLITVQRFCCASCHLQNNLSILLSFCFSLDVSLFCSRLPAWPSLFNASFYYCSYKLWPQLIHCSLFCYSCWNASIHLPIVLYYSKIAVAQIQPDYLIG